MSKTLSAVCKTIGFVSLAATLGGCVSNPSEMANTLNTASQVATAAQGGTNVAGAANALAAASAPGGIGGNSVAAMTNAQSDPRYMRGEEAMKQLYLPRASCADMQQKQQATLNSLAEIEPLTGNLMFKHLHERLRGQRDALANLGPSKKCKLPAVAGGVPPVTTAQKPVTFGKLSCGKLKEEYSKLSSDIAAAEVAEKANAQQSMQANQAGQIQGGIAALTQLSSMVGGAGAAGNLQQVNQMAQLAGSVAGATGNVQTASTAVSSTTQSLVLLQQKTELEAAADKKRCKL